MTDVPADRDAESAAHLRAAPEFLRDDQLPCGASVDDLLEQVADGQREPSTSHQRDCPHCQASLLELDRLWEPMRAAATLPTPTFTAIISDVMSRVRAQVANTWYTLDLGELGSLRIAARVVATIARDAARKVPGVRVALGRSTNSRLSAIIEKATLGHKHPNAAVGVLGRTAVVDLAVAVTYGDPVHEIAREVQRSVIDALRHDVGLQSVAVNVAVDDILEKTP
jgi:uncharacterized alkaline shock family protein YloU